jgi:hypothetical protein
VSDGGKKSMVGGGSSQLHPSAPLTAVHPLGGIPAGSDTEALGPSLDDSVASLQQQVAMAEGSLLHDAGGQAGEIQALLQPVKKTTQILEKISRLSASHTTTANAQPRTSAPS